MFHRPDDDIFKIYINEIFFLNNLIERFVNKYNINSPRVSNF